MLRRQEVSNFPKVSQERCTGTTSSPILPRLQPSRHEGHIHRIEEEDTKPTILGQTFQLFAHTIGTSLYYHVPCGNFFVLFHFCTQYHYLF